MTYLNARAKNTGNNQGDIIEHFDNNTSKKIQKNGGDGGFNWRTLECTESSCPHPVGTKTQLRLTNPSFDTTQFDKSFVTSDSDFTIKLDSPLPWSTDADDIKEHAHTAVVQIGPKNAVEFFKKTETMCNNVNLRNEQADAIRENFAYNAIKGKAQKTVAKYAHTTYENVANQDPSVCGVYQSIYELNDCQGHNINMELLCPYTDFLKYQAFEEYHNSIVGELREQVETSYDAFCVTPVHPSVTVERYEFMTGESLSTTGHDIPASLPITRKFSQIGTEVYLPYYAGKEEGWKTAKRTITITAGTVNKLQTTINGSRNKPETQSALRQRLEKDHYIPSQVMDRRHFTHYPTASGINANTDIALSNVTNITIMSPRRTNDVTCFENIMYKNVALSIDNHQYPDTEISTIGPRFYQMQLVANELDGTLEPTAEFEESFTQPLNDASGTRYNNRCSDGTSFGINFQLERSNGGYVFDGIDTGSKTVNVSFKGTPIYGGTNDTYYNYDPDNSSVHPPPPELWICRDTYFKMSTRGLEYVPHGIPPGCE